MRAQPLQEICLALLRDETRIFCTKYVGAVADTSNRALQAEADLPQICIIARQQPGACQVSYSPLEP
jgi:hypothetical protein